MIKRALTVSLGTLLLGACQHQGQIVPAVIADGSDATMDRLKSHLADAMGLAQISLGAGDPTAQSNVTVLPPPPGRYEARSPVTPVQFRLILVGEDCYAEREGSGERIELTGVPCRAL
nr:hypothetical protein [Hyphomonas sp. Mor2]